MSSGPDNSDRADWAYTALEAFAKETHQDTSGDLEHDIESVISDLLCDLMHYCGQESIDFPKILAYAQGNYEEEKDDEDEDEDE